MVSMSVQRPERPIGHRYPAGPASGQRMSDGDWPPDAVGVIVIRWDVEVLRGQRRKFSRRFLDHRHLFPACKRWEDRRGC